MKFILDGTDLITSCYYTIYMSLTTSVFRGYISNENTSVTECGTFVSFLQGHLLNVDTTLEMKIYAFKNHLHNFRQMFHMHFNFEIWMNLWNNKLKKINIYAIDWMINPNLNDFFISTMIFILCFYIEYCEHVFNFCSTTKIIF